MRYLFVIPDVFVKAGTPVGSDIPALLSPNQPFSAWNQQSGGTQITDLTAPDALTPITLDGGGNLTADSSGQPPLFRGPDWTATEVQALWIDAGGGRRFPVWPLEGLNLAVYNAVNGIGGTGGGGGTTGPITAADITDATALGRNLLLTAAAVDARSLIGAGTYTAPAVIAAGTTAALARSAIGFDPAVRADVPYGRMLWNTTTSTWWAYDPVTNTYVNGGPRPACPQGACVYDARNDAAATLPTGTQAPLPVSPNGMVGDEFKLHQSSSLIP